MPLRSTFEIGTQIILLKIDGFLKGWILNITPLKAKALKKRQYKGKKTGDVRGGSNGLCPL